MTAEYSPEWSAAHYEADAEGWKRSGKRDGMRCRRCGMMVSYLTQHAAYVHGDDVVVKPVKYDGQYDLEGRTNLDSFVWILRVGTRVAACFLDREAGERALRQEAAEWDDGDMTVVLESAPLVRNAAIATTA